MYLFSKSFGLHFLLNLFLHYIQQGLYLWFNHGQDISCGKNVSKIACFFGQEYRRVKNWSEIEDFFTSQTDFALIRTVFLRGGCNFPRRSTMHVGKNFLLTNLQKCFIKCIFSLGSESLFIQKYQVKTKQVKETQHFIHIKCSSKTELHNEM